MRRYIDADEFADFIKRWGQGSSLEDVIEWLQTREAEDVVEVVRCRDCKFYTFKPQQTSHVTSVQRCNRSPIICTKPDDYCSFGERTDT